MLFAGIDRSDKAPDYRLANPGAPGAAAPYGYCRGARVASAPPCPPWRSDRRSAKDTLRGKSDILSTP